MLLGRFYLFLASLVWRLGAFTANKNQEDAQNQNLGLVPF